MAKNPIAKSLRSPHLKMQTIKSKKAYTRKAKNKTEKIKWGLFDKSSHFLLRSVVLLNQMRGFYCALSAMSSTACGGGGIRRMTEGGDELYLQ